MKLKSKFFVMLLAAVGLVSCEPDMEKNSTWEHAERVAFNAALSSADSGADISTVFPTGAQFGVYAYQRGQSVEQAFAANRLFTLQADGSLKSEQGNIEYPGYGTDVNFIAYYPYAASAENSVALDISDQAVPASLDFCVADNATNKHFGDASVSLSFKHRMSRLIIGVANRTDLSDSDLKMSISGMLTKAVYNFKDKSFTFDEASTADVEMLLNDDKKVASAVVFPTNLSKSAQLNVEMGGKNVSVPLNTGYVSAGDSYSQYVILTQAEDGSLEATLGNPTSTEWKSVTGDDVTFDEKTIPADAGTLIFEELISATPVQKVNNAWVKVSAWTSWTSGLTITDTKNNLTVRANNNVNHIWFPSAGGELKLAGFDAKGYKKLTVSYQLTANCYNASDTQELNAMQVTFNGTTYTAESKVMTNAENNTFFDFSIEIPTTDVKENAAENVLSFVVGQNLGMRLANIRLTGKK